MSESVIGIVFNCERNEVLVVQRRDTGVWALPGGGIDPNETPEMAVIREILEETGYQTEITHQVAEYTPINTLSRKTYSFTCHVLNGKATENDEAKAVGFYPINNLPPPFFYIHEGWIRDALQYNGSINKRALTEVTYGALFKYMIKHPVTLFRFLLCRLGFPINSK